MIKTALLHIAVLEFTCPTCGEHLSSDDGTHLFILTEPLPETVECFQCQVEVKIPARAKKIQEAS